jgi:hypothetical protein
MAGRRERVGRHARLSHPIDTIEHMFETVAMASSSGSSAAALTAEPIDDAPDRLETVRALQERIRGMQRTRLDSRALPTHPALGGLLPGGALAAGGSYAVAGSTSLALGLLQAASEAGSWCAVVGVPDLGVEAAAGLGIDLDRLVLVPHPGQHWLTVVSALVDVVSVVLVRPPRRDAGRGASGAGGSSGMPGGSGRAAAARRAIAPIGDAAAAKLAARLRTRESVLVSLGDWPGAEARLAVTDSSWAGIGAGFGHLLARQVTVDATSPAWAGRTRSRRLWLPGPDQRLQAVEPRGAQQAAGADAARVERRAPVPLGADGRAELRIVG